MSNGSGPILELRAFVLLMFAALVGCATGVLTSLTGANLPQCVIAGGAAAGAALLGAAALIR